MPLVSQPRDFESEADREEREAVISGALVYTEGPKEFACEVCNGTGSVNVKQDPMTGQFDSEDCWACQGEGVISHEF